jgi:DNA-binding transcriptional regulator GbsR (MarR family)
MEPDPAIALTSELDRETMVYWVEVATALGFSRSAGEVYGLIFLSAEPLNADDIVEKLRISRSGVGQALKLLAEIGAIRPARHLQSRKDHYELQTDLGVLIRLFLNSRVLPRLEELGRRRLALAAEAQKAGPEHLNARFEKLSRWQGKTAPLMAIIKGLAAE